MAAPDKAKQDTRIKQAELLSTLGAGALGAGLALLFDEALAPYKLAILVAGLLAHAIGMFRKHRLETRSGIARSRWVEALYWLCWVVLAGLLFFILARQL